MLLLLFGSRAGASARQRVCARRAARGSRRRAAASLSGVAVLDVVPCPRAEVPGEGRHWRHGGRCCDRLLWGAAEASRGCCRGGRRGCCWSYKLIGVQLDVAVLRDTVRSPFIGAGANPMTPLTVACARRGLWSVAAEDPDGDAERTFVTCLARLGGRGRGSGAAFLMRLPTAPRRF